MSLFRKKELSVLMEHIEGIQGIGKTACRISFDDEFVKIEQMTLSITGAKPVRTFKIKISEVIAFDIINQKNVEQKSKSVVGRGIAGGIVFGPVGLLLGGLSGTGSKTKVNNKNFLVISYGADEIKTLTFVGYDGRLGYFDLAKEFKKKYLPCACEEGGEVIL